MKISEHGTKSGSAFPETEVADLVPKEVVQHFPRSKWQTLFPKKWFHGVGKYNSSNRRCAGAPNLQDFSQRPDWGAIGPPLPGCRGAPDSEDLVECRGIEIINNFEPGPPQADFLSSASLCRGAGAPKSECRGAGAPKCSKSQNRAIGG